MTDHFTSWQAFRSWVQGIVHPHSSHPPRHCVHCSQRQHLDDALSKPRHISQGSLANIGEVCPYHPLPVITLWADCVTGREANAGLWVLTALMLCWTSQRKSSRPKRHSIYWGWSQVNHHSCSLLIESKPPWGFFFPPLSNDRQGLRFFLGFSRSGDLVLEFLFILTKEVESWWSGVLIWEMWIILFLIIKVIHAWCKKSTTRQKYIKEKVKSLPQPALSYQAPDIVPLSPKQRLLVLPLVIFLEEAVKILKLSLWWY